MTSPTDWTGRVGDVWAAEWRRTDRSFADLSRHLDAAILAAAPDGPFRALDIGCGAGGTSLALATTRTDATIIGVDLSTSLVDVANDRLIRAVLSRGRIPGAICGSSDAPWDRPAPEHGGAVGNVTFLAGDALDLATVHAPFDLLYSRHGVMFFDDPVAAFATLRHAAVPGARLIFSCFRNWSANAFATAPAEALGLSPPGSGPGPFAFADRDRVAGILAGAGWRDAHATPVAFAYRAGGGTDPLGDALEMLQRIGPAAAALRGMADGDRGAAIDRLRGVIDRYRTTDAVDFPAAAWIWSAKA
ncbi:class I SAM-dependent methyltransferase [uncultured Sphingomonas sp.]|uniref:class I SAM-dependent methyltransferase n=1 Tax=uncultured Sphingomonas sp. TaxID=158754 RepID=UPI0025D591F3|nr:class I SAM-dependent methyltransferase [uncultured Sphingomonas sp.]